MSFRTGAQVDWHSNGSVWGDQLDALVTPWMEEKIIPRVCAMKLDIEGSEYRALLGASRVLSQIDLVGAADIAKSP